MFNACIFCYTACDPDDIKILYKNQREVLCFTHDCCLAMGDSGYSVGVDMNKAALIAAKAGKSFGKCCEIKLFCCALGCKFPEVCCKGATHCLCLKEGEAVPFDGETVTEPLCAICFVQLLPEVGILKTAPNLPSMSR
jgi:hypothetical protein